MKFRVKRYDEAGKEIIEEVIEHYAILEKRLEKQFVLDDNVARFETMKMADGRKSYSLKDRANKIIIQYKQI